MALLHAIDDTVLAVYLLVTLSVSVQRALRRRRRVRATLRTAAAGRQAPRPGHSGVMTVAVSVVATFMSAAFTLGVTAEVFQHGAAWLLSALGSLVAGPIIAFVFVPVLHKLKVSSVHEYLYLRFGDGLSPVVGSVGTVLQTVVHVSVLLQAASLVTAAVTGLRRTAALLVTAAIGITWATLGVPDDRVFSDCVHSAVTLVGLIAAVMQGAGTLGGITNILKINRQQGRLDILQFSVDPFESYNFWNVVIGGALMWIHWFVASPTMLQQYSSLRTLQRTRTAVLVSVVLVLGVTSLCVLAALAMVASWQGCWPAAWPADALLLRWVGRRLGYLPGLAGLLLAALLGGALAAGPAQLTAQAAAVWDQLADRRVRHDWRRLAVRLISVVLGLICLGLAATVTAGGGGSLLQTWVAVYGATAGPLLGLLTVGMLVPFASPQGAVAGYFCGLGLALWTAFGAIFCNKDAVELPMPGNATSCYDVLNASNVSASTDVYAGNRIAINILVANVTSVYAFNGTIDAHYRSALERWYSLSFLLIGPLATVVTVLAGTLVSLLPGCRYSSHLRRDTLSPLVTWLVSKDKLATYTDQELLNRSDEPEPGAAIEMDNIDSDADHVQQLYEDHNPLDGHLELYGAEENQSSAV